MSGVECELADEFALGTAVALAEGMDGVDLAQIEGGSGGEDFRGEIDEEGFGPESGEGVLESCGDVLRGSEGRAALGEIDDAEFAGPGEEVLEEKLVDGLEVGWVELAGDAFVAEFAAALEVEGSLKGL